MNYLFWLALTYAYRLEINLKLYLTVFELSILLKNKSLLEYLKNDSSSSCTIRSTVFVSSRPEMCWRSLSTVWERISCVDLTISLVMNVIEDSHRKIVERKA
jgi:hypothetical protein